MAIRCAVIGSGNIGTDLMEKLLASPALELQAMVGIDPASSGLTRARERGIETTHEGLDWLLSQPDLPAIVFEATSAAVHAAHAPRLQEAGLRVVDLTPAAIGPYVVPCVNLEEHLDEANLNMVTCGGQATVPSVAAAAAAARVVYAEIIATIASRSAGPGTRANIDEFTQTTARSLVELGGAETGKAIIILNPADPPILMRDTIYLALGDDADEGAVAAAVGRRVDEVAGYVPGYRLKDILFDEGSFRTPRGLTRRRCTVFIEVEGAGDFLPSYAGNLDIMTAAAVQVGEQIARHLDGERTAAR